jgi:hypothetical protein
VSLIVLGFRSGDRERVQAALEAAGLDMTPFYPKHWHGEWITEWLALDEKRIEVAQK